MPFGADKPLSEAPRPRSLLARRIVRLGIKLTRIERSSATPGPADTSALRDHPIDDALQGSRHSISILAIPCRAYWLCTHACLKRQAP